MATTAAPEASAAGEGRSAIPRHAYFALALLTGANLLNQLDRQILSILAQSIKADLKLDDAQLGFLMGTAFAVFYAVVGIAMGRIADRISRKKLMAFGLALWSTMTAFGGLATNFLWLSLARIGVGVGEATANPCSHALLADIFPARNRASALAVYLCGTYLGGAMAMIVGAMFVQHWPDYCQAVPIAGACGIPGWKAALLAVGLPGIPLALLLLLIREPSRKILGSASAARDIVAEVAAALPPFTLVTVNRLGGKPEALRNLTVAAAIVVAAVLLTAVTGDVAQWGAAGLGGYAVYTWGQVQKLRDRPLYAVTFGCKTFVLAMSGSALLACIGGGVSVWTAPYAMRTLHLTPVETGLALGLLHTTSAVFGVILGGLLTDRWKRRDARAPIWIALISLFGQLPFLVAMLTAPNATFFFAAYTGFGLFTSLWGGAFAAMVQDLVLPRMRGSAASAFSLVSIVVASSAGPYWVGKVSAISGSLEAGLYSLMLLVPIAVVVFAYTLPLLRAESPERRRALAEAVGEPREPY